jgi:16S rRNA (cytosine1402-N4)-methyltransferase
MHIPVLINEIKEAFSPLSIKTFVDATCGLGGHSLAILSSHPEIEVFYAIDRDPEALKIAKETLKPFQHKVHFVHANFRDLGSITPPSFDGILFDLGVSSLQLDTPERGFSFMNDAPLDMRMNPDDPTTAEEVVNKFGEKKLEEILLTLGEERRARAIAHHIVEERKRRSIATTGELAELIEEVVPRRGRTHPATQTFQALRMFVNRELESIEEGLKEAEKRLAPGGRIAVISFHSLEDRIVKYAFRGSSLLQILTKKPIIPLFDEIRKNRRARSAKLRLAEKKPLL